MSIDSNTVIVPGPMKAVADHGHDHAHHHAQAHDSPAVAKPFSPFLASVLDRLGLAVVFAGLVWIGVFWAVR
ncbi:hypothetical protein [Kaistia soli]|uniref:hypothetical protein n=1 Tax=Kaistia soli TaxID=446684 RepID=UPI0009324187|nr:hypothetical protein [Kaistia soli]